MLHVKSISDDFYVNVNVNTEMELPTSREGVMHYFEQMQRRYPTMKHFYTRERGEYVLEEDKEPGFYRWTSVEPRRICTGYVNPDDYGQAIAQHEYVLEQLPYTLSVSPLDCESLNFMFGFDFTYRGNHNELIAEALGLTPAFERLAEIAGTRLISHDPAVQFSLDEDCRVQCRISIESRTNIYHVRTGEFPEEQLSVYLTVRRYGSLEPGQTFVQAIKPLQEHAEQIVEGHLINNVLVPLQQAIAIK
ncbi:MAG: hypothetical protein ACR2NP_11380 [Pirellulaceae bacterium]